MSGRTRSFEDAFGSNTQTPTETNPTEMQSNDSTRLSATREQESDDEFDAESLFWQAFRYEHGMGFGKDVKKAVQLYQKAADQGDTDAIIRLATIYLEGSYGVNKDLDKGLQLYQNAADQRNTTAMRQLTEIYLEGSYGVNKDLDKGLQLYQKAADQGDLHIMKLLAEIYLEGSYGVDKDLDKGLQLYQRAADLEDTDAIIELAVIYLKGSYGVSQDLDKGLQLYQKAADQGDTDAMRWLAEIYLKGSYGVNKDLDKGLQLNRKGAKLNDENCMYELGCCYRDGTGTPRDVEQARTWFKKSFEHGRKNSLFGWALTKLEKPLTPSQKTGIDELLYTFHADYVVAEWIEWNSHNDGENQSDDSTRSLFDRLDATNAAFLCAQLLASTLDPSPLKLAQTLIKDIPPDTDALHVPSQWVKLLIEDQHDEDELWSKEKLPNDKAFSLQDEIFPIALIGFGQFGKVYLSWLRYGGGIYVVIKFIRFDLATKNKIAARNVVREQLTCRVLNAEGVKNTLTYLGYTDHVESQQRGLIFELCADINDVKELADKEKGENIRKRFGHTIQLEKLPDWTDRVRSSLRSSVVICEQNKWSVAQVITMLRQAAEALLEVHKLGFIHRDIADRNILCDEEGKIQLADFGLAKYVGSSHDDSELLLFYSKTYFTSGHQYALAWWAPECFGWEDRGIDGVFSWNSDVYAFGMTMWQCFAHKDPFSDVKPEKGKEDEVADRIKAQILEGERPSLIKKGKVFGVLDPDTPDDLLTLIDSCWKTEPDKRPTLLRVIEELQRIESNVKQYGASLRGGRMAFKGKPHESWFDVAGMYKYRKPPKKESPASSPGNEMRGGTHADIVDKNERAREHQLKNEVENRVPENVRTNWEQLPYDVFLVHAGEQKLGPVDTMKHFLEESKLRCFLDREMTVGSPSKGSMRFALTTCRYAVVVLSREYFTKPNPASELMYAYERMLWISRQDHLKGWYSLIVVMLDLTVKDYKEGLGSCCTELPHELCDVTLIEWSAKGTNTWREQSEKLGTDLHRHDNNGALEKWNQFLLGFNTKVQLDFPPANKLYV